MADFPPISIAEGAKMLGITETELRQLLEADGVRPGDRRCVQAAFYLLQTESVWQALSKARAAAQAKMTDHGEKS